MAPCILPYGPDGFVFVRSQGGCRLSIPEGKPYFALIFSHLPTTLGSILKMETWIAGPSGRVLGGRLRGL